MKYRIDLPRVGRFFSVPCSAVDKYIKTADADSESMKCKNAPGKSRGKKYKT